MGLEERNYPMNTATKTQMDNIYILHPFFFSLNDHKYLCGIDKYKVGNIHEMGPLTLLLSKSKTLSSASDQDVCVSKRPLAI